MEEAEKLTHRHFVAAAVTAGRGADLDAVGVIAQPGDLHRASPSTKTHTQTRVYTYTPTSLHMEFTYFNGLTELSKSSQYFMHGSTEERPNMFV